MMSLIYLYGLTWAKVRPPSLAPCVDGSYRLVKHVVNGIGVWYSEVNREDFGASLAQRLEDLDWVASNSVRHQETVAAIARRGAIVPARFATMFTSVSSLTADVEIRTPEIGSKLRRIRDADEWGVKVFRSRKTRSVAGSHSTGADYLRQKAALRTSGSNRTGHELMAELLQSLSKESAASALTDKLSSGQQNLHWQASFLVKRSHKASWDAVLASQAKILGPTYVIECTGPWPPYSFV